MSECAQVAAGADLDGEVHLGECGCPLQLTPISTKGHHFLITTRVRLGHAPEEALSGTHWPTLEASALERKGLLIELNAIDHISRFIGINKSFQIFR